MPYRTIVCQKNALATASPSNEKIRTARDRVARVHRLRTLRDQAGHPYDVIACIAGRGFKVRREDMRPLLPATDGNVFTLPTMHRLIDQTRIR